MNRLILYSTPGCHLCELAKAQVQPLLVEFSLQLIEVDIAANDQQVLFEKYGARIPVIKMADQHQELAWPFDTQQAHALLMSWLALGGRGDCGIE